MHLSIDLLQTRVFLFLVAFVLTVITSYLSGKWGKSIWSPLWRFFSNISLFLNSKLNKLERKSGDLFLRGLFSTLICLSVGYALTVIYSQILLIFEFKIYIELLVLILFLSPFSLIGLQVSLNETLKSGKPLNNVYYCLAQDMRLDLKPLDDFGLVRLSILSSCLHFERSFLAPLFVYLLFGISGVIIYTSITALFWISGRMGHGSRFSKISHVLSWILNIVPNALSAFLFIVAAAFTPSAKMRFGLKALFASHKGLTWAQGGMAANVLAHVLDVTIGGPLKSIDGRDMPNIWIGREGVSAKLSHEHLRRVIYLQVVTYVLSVLGALSVFLL